METEARLMKETGERLSALLLAIAATVLVFAAISAGFTPHATALAGRVVAGPVVSL